MAEINTNSASDDEAEESKDCNCKTNSNISVKANFSGKYFPLLSTNSVFKNPSRFILFSQADALTFPLLIWVVLNCGSLSALSALSSLTLYPNEEAQQCHSQMSWPREQLLRFDQVDW